MPEFSEFAYNKITEGATPVYIVYTVKDAVARASIAALQPEKKYPIGPQPSGAHYKWEQVPNSWFTIPDPWQEGESFEVYASNLWSDGDNLYCYVDIGNSFRWDKTTHTWELTDIVSDNPRIFSIGVVVKDAKGRILNFSNNDGYVFYYDKDHHEWKTISMTMPSEFPVFSLDRIWSDGTNIYYSDRSDQYVLANWTTVSAGLHWTYKNWTNETSVDDPTFFSYFQPCNICQDEGHVYLFVQGAGVAIYIKGNTYDSWYSTDVGIDYESYSSYIPPISVPKPPFASDVFGDMTTGIANSGSNDYQRFVQIKGQIWSIRRKNIDYVFDTKSMKWSPMFVEWGGPAANKVSKDAFNIFCDGYDYYLVGMATGPDNPSTHYYRLVEV